MNTQFKANNKNTISYPPLSCDLHTGSGIGASFWFHQSHLLPMLLLPLRHRGCLSDITGALFCSPGAICGWFLVSTPFECCFYRPFACFCHEMIFYLGGYDHCVLYTTAQLTEGRSARDQPKQPPAKKASAMARGGSSGEVRLSLLANRCPNSASDGEFRKEPPCR